MKPSVARVGMRQIELSENIFIEASRQAEASGVSVQTFISDVLNRHLGLKSEAEALRLTPEQAELVRHTQGEVRAGRYLTLDQVKEDLAANRAKWLSANPH